MQAVGPSHNSLGESYDGRAAVPSISREIVADKSCRVTATQTIINVTEQSVCFPRPKSRRLHGVGGPPCDWGMRWLTCAAQDHFMFLTLLIISMNYAFSLS